jgi:hypothetical protein
MAGTLLFDEKIRQSAALFWFGLQGVGILQIFYSRAIKQRTIVDFPAFLETPLAGKDCDLCPYNPFELFSNIQYQN